MTIIAPYLQRQPEQSLQSSLTDPRGNDVTIYIVDDDLAMRKSLERLLRSAGWHVIALSSACEFLEHSSIARHGCVLLDVVMSGMNGLELQECMAEKGIALPVVFMTGSGDVATSVRAMKRGAFDFLVKPVDEQALFQTLQQAVAWNKANCSSSDTTSIIKARLDQLTPREYQVLALVSSGLLNKQVAFELDISEKTVKVHRGRVMEKMEAGSLAELVHMLDAANITFADFSASPSVATA